MPSAFRSYASDLPLFRPELRFGPGPEGRFHQRFCLAQLSGIMTRQRAQVKDWGQFGDFGVPPDARKEVFPARTAVVVIAFGVVWLTIGSYANLLSL